MDCLEEPSSATSGLLWLTGRLNSSKLMVGILCYKFQPSPVIVVTIVLHCCSRLRLNSFSVPSARKNSSLTVSLKKLHLWLSGYSIIVCFLCLKSYSSWLCPLDLYLVEIQVLNIFKSKGEGSLGATVKTCIRVGCLNHTPLRCSLSLRPHTQCLICHAAGCRSDAVY